MSVLKMIEQDLAGKRILIRQDLNVPIKNSRVVSDARIRASLPTIQTVFEAGGCVLLMSHLGRPVEGKYNSKYSLAPVAEHLSCLLNSQVRFASHWLNGIEVGPGEIVLCENVRFNIGEKSDDEALARQMASLCHVYVMDAFGTAHRAQASTHGVARFAPIACAGPLLTSELESLGKALDKPARPLVAIVGGAKVSTKLTVLESLSETVDQLIPGGGIANTFIAAAGFPVGKSLVEVDLIPRAKELMIEVAARGGEIPVPDDVVVSKTHAEGAQALVKDVTDVADDDMIFDIGPKTAQRFAQMLYSAATVVWNGPVGVFELDQFGGGTQVLGQAIAESNAFSIAGGGDTLAAIDKYNIRDRISYISTGGGAFLEFLEGRKLPAVAILEQRAAE